MRKQKSRRPCRAVSLLLRRDTRIAGACTRTCSNCQGVPQMQAESTLAGVRPARPRHLARTFTPYLFILPFFTIQAVFLLYPVVSALFLSFYQATGVGARKFIGLGNYVSLVQDPRYLHALLNTTEYALGSILILSPLALLIALAVRSFIEIGRASCRERVELLVVVGVVEIIE